MEAAQVQGLGAWLSKMVLEDPFLRALFPSIDPDKLVQFILKLCSVHLERSTDELVPLVGQDTVNYLNRIRGLSDAGDIENWHRFCKTHENKKLRDWYAHKVNYPWMLPGYNETLSSFPNGYWQQSPSHTNLVESAHVATNKATKINLLPVESCRTARKFDFAKAASLAAARETCILVNRNNDDQTRMGRTVTRSAKRHSYRQEHDVIGDSITNTQQELAAATQARKDLAARLKELKSQKKEMGRVPRHNSDVDSPTIQTTSSSPVSSPPPRLRLIDEDDTESFPSEARLDTSVTLPDVDVPMPNVISDFSVSSSLPISDENLAASTARTLGVAPGFPTPLSDLSGQDMAELETHLFSLASAFPGPSLDISDAEMAAFLGTADLDPNLFFRNDVLDFGDSDASFLADFVSQEQFPIPPALSTPQEWPLLPPAPSTSPSVDSPATIPIIPVSPLPAARKRRLEVDPANIVIEPRARKVRENGVMGLGSQRVRGATIVRTGPDIPNGNTAGSCRAYSEDRRSASSESSRSATGVGVQGGYSLRRRAFTNAYGTKVVVPPAETKSVSKKRPSSGTPESGSKFQPPRKGTDSMRPTSTKELGDTTAWATERKEAVLPPRRIEF
ncbi:hypothetical protein B0H11DRAFT_2389991 [Mycena galericulata]|nr:hypothetical protein B0H11DRAFT_2389991 [Mycena galericulata]